MFSRRVAQRLDRTGQAHPTGAGLCGAGSGAGPVTTSGPAVATGAGVAKAENAQALHRDDCHAGSEGAVADQLLPCRQELLVNTAVAAGADARASVAGTGAGR